MDKMNLWSYGQGGAKISALVAGAGTALSAALGGWDSMVQALVIFMAADFVLGFTAAGKARRINSHVMFWGGVNKLMVLLFVGLGAVLDGVVGLPEPYIRTAVIWFYIGREGLSVVENYGKLGMPLPAFISALLEQLKGQGDRGESA